MAADERVARFRRGTPAGSTEYADLPDDGMCVSIFVLVHPPGDPHRLLLGRLNPAADWARLGALDAERVRRIGDRWMLPSGHLKFFEPPDAGARRLVRDQVGAELARLEGPQVFSEAYGREGGTAKDPHWDLHLVYRGELGAPPPARSVGFTEMRFLDPSTTRADQIARAQGDVLELAGFSVLRDP